MACASHVYRAWRPRFLGSPTDASASASGGESGGIGRYNERETLSRCDTIAERDCKGRHKKRHPLKTDA